MGDEYDYAELDYWCHSGYHEYNEDEMTDIEYDESLYTDMTPRNHRERTNVKTNDALLAEAIALEERATELRRRAEERDKYGPDPFKNGAVLKVDMKYRTGNRSYAYAVIKIAGKFYLSGRMGAGTQSSITTDNRASGMTWDNFVAWLAQGDATVWQTKTLERIF